MADEVNKAKKLPRHPMPEQEARVRARNFDEVPFGYSNETAMAEASRCLRCKKPKCVEGCPVNVKIPEFVGLIADGDFIGAAHKLKETNALPAVCGRVCPQESQCEARCVLTKKGESVAIGRLERFAADYERNQGEIKLPKIAPATGKKVAVIGGGPAGLTVAGDLVKLGHEVTIFEALHKTGGVLVYGIPEFRLPKAIVQAEVDYLKSLGVKIVESYVVGQIETVDELLERFDACFIGTGAGLPVFMKLEGENLNGVYSANE
jgi:glutamate synthase (NADPH/NADH) small chain